jgi:hypothetical protein
MSKFTIKVELTFSKIAGGVCILAGIAMIFVGDSTNAVLAMGFGSGLIGVKTITARKK